MKRALSLIIVLAMVLCMIPFSAFAVDTEIGTGEDFVDGTITLTAENNYEASYLWTAEENGTLTLSYTCDVEGAEIGFEVDSAAYTGPIEVVAGQPYAITVYENTGSFVSVDVTVFSLFKGVLGTETNPYEIWNPDVEGEEGIEFPENNSTTTIEIEPGASVYYMLYYYTGNEVTFTGNGVTVTMLGKTVDGTQDGFITVPFGTDSVYRTVLVKFTNKSAEPATYEVTSVVPNSMSTPQEVTDGTYEATLTAGDDGYFYSYTAAGDGTVSVSVAAADAEGNAIGWIYSVEVVGGVVNDLRFSDDNPPVNPDTIAVTAGDVVKVMVNTYDPADMWNNPAGVITTTFEFVAEGAEEPEAAELVLGDNELNVANGATNEYTFTPDQDGTLTVAVTALDPSTGNLGMTFGMGSMTLLVNGENFFSPNAEIAVTAGTPVTVSLINKAGQDETVTLNLAMAEPAGPGESEETAIAIELPWEVTHTGEHDMYYTYTATEDCIVKVTSTAAYTLGISGVESKTYDSLTKYVELATGDTIIINTYSSEDCTYSASIVDALPAGNGSYYFPYVIENLPYTSDINNGDASLYYSYTAAKAATLVFSSENMGAVNVTLNGAWDVLDAENKLVVAAGDVVTINTYEGAFTVDYVPPVAVIGDAEYTTIDEAVAAAVNGDTITLVADATADAGIVLPVGVNLDLGEYSLTAPYVVAFAGSSITGVVGTASITADNLVAGIVNIDGTDYEWTATEGVYTLTEVVPVAPPAAEEEKVASYNGEELSLSEALSKAAASNPDANNRAVVTLIANAEVDYNVIIDPYVTLNIGSFSLTAPNVIGLADSMINAALPGSKDTECVNCGKVIVPSSKNLVMSAVAHRAVSDTTVCMPVWTGDMYIFSVGEVAKKDWTISDDGDVTMYKFATNFSGSVRKKYLTNGIDDNGLSIIVTAGWWNGEVKVEQNYYYTGSLIDLATNQGTLSAETTGCSNKSEFFIYGSILTECGVVVVGAEQRIS